MYIVYSQNALQLNIIFFLPQHVISLNSRSVSQSQFFGWTRYLLVMFRRSNPPVPHPSPSVLTQTCWREKIHLLSHSRRPTAVLEPRYDRRGILSCSCSTTTATFLPKPSSLPLCWPCRGSHHAPPSLPPSPILKRGNEIRGGTRKPGQPNASESTIVIQ